MEANGKRPFADPADSSRRQFVKAGLAAGLFQIVPRHVLGGNGYTAPSEKLNLAGIGFGGMGGRNLRNCGEEAIVALCDVDHRYAGRVFDMWPQARRYTDFREMLDQESDLDGVIVGTPDHTHAAISMAVLDAGCHLFCQKPLTHDLYESRVLSRKAAETGLVTQLGIQGHSGAGRVAIKEWIQSGVLGAVAEVDAWCSLSYSPPGHASWSSPCRERPSSGQPVPEGLKSWDLWIGPSPMRPYHSCYHPRVWRCWWDFGCGMMGDRGVHTFDPIVSALELGPPESVEAWGVEGGNDEVHPDRVVVRYRFPARDGFPPLTLTWYEGQEPPRPKELEPGRELPKEGGVIFKGEQGALMCGVYGDSPRLIPESAMEAFRRPPRTLPRIRGSHEGEWLRAIRQGRPANAGFAYSGPLNETVLLGNVAKRFPGRLLEWDAENLRVRHLPEASSWIRRPRRDGWSL